MFLMSKNGATKRLCSGFNIFFLLSQPFGVPLKTDRIFLLEWPPTKTWYWVPLARVTHSARTRVVCMMHAFTVMGLVSCVARFFLLFFPPSFFVVACAAKRASWVSLIGGLDWQFGALNPRFS